MMYLIRLPSTNIVENWLFDVIYVMLKKTLNKYDYYLLLEGKLKINILTPTLE